MNEPKLLGVREKEGKRGARTGEWELLLTRPSGSLVVVPLDRADLFNLAAESITALRRMDAPS